MASGDNDLIQYVRESSTDMRHGAKYLVDIANLADQIKDIPDSRTKLAAELGRKRLLLEAHLIAVQGLLQRTAPASAKADHPA
jgi:hypothetical protein